MTNQLLQIVHVSDLHVVLDRSHLRKWRRWCDTERMRNSPLGRQLIEGMAPHQPFLLGDLARFVRDEVLGEAWSADMTWIICSGDLSTWGDQASISEALSVLVDAASPGGACRVLYGNHDAWPGEFPLLADARSIRRQRDWLRTSHFPQRWPETTLASRGPIDVRLYTLNSVLHHQVRNTLAIGSLAGDRYWDDGLREGLADQQVAELDLLMKGEDRRRGSGRELRILALHHPLLADTSTASTSNADWSAALRRYWPVSALARRRAAAEALSLDTSTTRAHLILSGHTHKLAPASLLDGSSGDGALQLTVGSACQQDELEVHDRPCHGQVIRLYAGDGPGEVVGERLLFQARGGGSRWRRRGFGGYGWAHDAQGEPVAERFSLQLEAPSTA